MKISLDWLKEFIKLEDPTETIGHRLTMGGLEVEGIEKFEAIEGNLAGLVIGEVLTCAKHPGADKLSVTTVDIGAEEPQPIVCGAPNVAAGQKVVVATVGSTLYPLGGEPFKIKKAKIRGEASQGMICAEDEIGLGASHDGIMVLDTDLPNGTPAAGYFKPFQDEVFEIGLTPNRADAASHFGTARDLKALYRQEVSFPETDAFTADTNDLPIEVIVENTSACPRYAGLTISGITVKESPEWLQNRLKSIGLSPINNVVDVTNYILHGLGQPLHAFDAAVAGKTIRVKNLPTDTPFVTLDEVERKLQDFDLMICDGDSKPMCIGGVFGGIDSGVKDSTTAIFLESAYFHPDHIRKTALHHGLKTDASFRFERGTDPDMPVKALKVAAQLIKEVAGGSISSEIVDIYPEPIPPFEVHVKYAHIHRLIGKELSKVEIKQILENLEMKVQNETEENFTAIVPPYRVDVQREADIIEDILRIHGFNEVALNPHLSTDFLANHPRPNEDAMQYALTQLLAGAGASEIMTNSLTTSTYSEKMKGVEVNENVNILNTLSADLDVMRQSLIFSGLEVVAHNINRKQQDLKLFEFGKTYHLKAEKYIEHKVLSLWVTGNQQEESWQGTNKPSNFYTLSGLAQKVLQKLILADLEGHDSDHPDLAYGLALKKGEKTIAHLGLIHPKLTKEAGVKQEVFYAELDWQAIIKKYSNQNLYKEIPKFPEVRRDLSLVLDKNVTFDQIKTLAQKTERKLLQKVNVFDVYEGENLGEGKKSYSIYFILQDANDNLTDKRIDKTMNKLIATFEKELGAVIRR